MLRLQNQTYVSRVHQHAIKLIYRGHNQCELYIDGRYQGLCPFDYTKKKINEIEENVANVFDIKTLDGVFWEELKGSQFDNKT